MVRTKNYPYGIPRDRKFLRVSDGTIDLIWLPSLKKHLENLLGDGDTAKRIGRTRVHGYFRDVSDDCESYRDDKILKKEKK